MHPLQQRYLQLFSLLKHQPPGTVDSLQVLFNALINKYLLNFSLVFLYFLIESLVIMDTIYGGGHFWTPQTFVMSVRNLFNDNNCDVSKTFCHNCVWH